MTLHIFNPEHDLALACNQPNFTPPAAARRLRADLGFIPFLWANDGDIVLVDDMERAIEGMAMLKGQLAEMGYAAPIYEKGVALVGESDIADLPIDNVDVWGWDVAVCHRLRRMGVADGLLPDSDSLAAVRDLSHRRLAAELLKHIRTEGTVGESFVCGSYDEVEHLLAVRKHIVVKAPWSCSGRGIRFVERSANAHQEGWIKNMLKAQGSVIVEPYYKKIRDFGMEFVCDGAGGVSYVGLSLFDTDNWAYTGSLLDTEEHKACVIGADIPLSRLYGMRDRIADCLGRIYAGRYRGPFGVDMMIVTDGDGDRRLLHPCVEINLRRTMGHAAIMSTPVASVRRGLMRIEYINNKYHLKIKSL